MKQQLKAKYEHIDYSRFSVQAAKDFVTGKSIAPMDLYNAICSYLKRFVYFTDDRHFDLLAVWVIGTYLFPVFRHYPYLWLNAEKGSGKTTVLEVICPICFNGQMLVSPTAAVLFREVDANRVTLLIDEFEGMTKGNKEIAGAVFDILNVGYNKEGVVKRVEAAGSKGEYSIRTFSAYCPKVFSGIRKIDETLRDRTIQIRMLRKGGGDRRERYKVTQTVETLHGELRDMCYNFALCYASQVASVYESGIIEQVHLSHLQNRELDLWEPLLSILHIIDSGGLSGITVQLIGLSEEAFEEKSTENIDDNETCKIILALKTLLDSETTYHDVADSEGQAALRGYKAIDAMKFWSAPPLEDIAHLSQKEVSSRLKRLNISVKQRRIDGERHTVYAFSSQQIVGLMERFNVLDV